MNSSQQSADAVRAAISSTTTCTPATVTLLSDLLSSRAIATPNTSGSSKTIPKATAKPTKKSTIRAPASRSKVNEADKENANANDNVESLSAKEKFTLATEVVNNTLKVLTEAIKVPSQPRKAPTTKEKAAARKGLRRSSSVPQAPLQPRALNRVSSSPNISKTRDGSASSTSACSPGVRSVAECARAAFLCLRGIQAANITGLTMPPLQLENGMSVLVGKLLALGLEDLATKELRILKRRLDVEIEGKSAPVTKDAASISTPQTLAELLDFGEISATGAKLGLLITTQLQALRLMIASRKPKSIEAAMPFLRPGHASSPVKLLLKAAEDSTQVNKSARQLQTLSDMLLSMSPSVSSSEDATALDCKVSITPQAAFILQALALDVRLSWWKLANHKGHVEKDIFDPFLRCVQAFARRSQNEADKVYTKCSNAFSHLKKSSLKYETDGLKSAPALIGIYRILGSLSKEANIIDEAIEWVGMVRNLLDSKADSNARHSALTARLVSLTLRGSQREQTKNLLIELLDVLEQPFKGEASEIDELLTEVSSARRAAIIAISNPVSESSSNTNALSPEVRQMCETLVSLCPRLSLRYIGKKPDENASSKDVVRFEQRRKFITKPSVHAIDSALFLVKLLLKQEAPVWERVDSLLQDCLALLDRLEQGSMEDENFNATQCYIKISNLYFMCFLDLRRNNDVGKGTPQTRVVLRRSIDCLKSRPLPDRNAGLMSMKLERLADLSKSMGRFDELFKALVMLRDETVENGVLCKVVENAKILSIRKAWECSDDAQVLARTIQSLVKVYLNHSEISPEPWLFGLSWTDEQKGAVLEHELDILAGLTNPTSVAMDLKSKVFEHLISLYDLNQYPVRRLRAMTIFQHSHNEQQGDCMVETLTALMSKSIDIDTTKDSGLAGYLRHWVAMAVSIMELQKDEICIKNLKNCIVNWRTILSEAENLAALQLRIENIPQLLLHLQSLANFMEMRGLETDKLVILRLIADYNELYCEVSGHNDIVSTYSALGLSWLQLGYSGKAGLALDKAQSFSLRSNLGAKTDLHIAHSQYMLALGNLEKCQFHLECAEGAFILERKELEEDKSPLSLQEKTRLNCVVAKASLIRSMLAIEQGGSESALVHAKQSVRLLRRAWATTEAILRKKKLAAVPRDDAEKVVDGLSQLDISTNKIAGQPQPQDSPSGIGFWPLVAPLFHGLIHLSNLYAHHGLFQETLHYGEQAHELIKSFNFDGQSAIALATLGNIWTKAGNLDKGTNYLTDAEKFYKDGTKGKSSVTVACQIGRLRGMLGDRKAEIACLEEANQTLKTLIDPAFLATLELGDISAPDVPDTLETGIQTLSISKRKAPAARKTTTRKKLPVPRKPVVRSKTPTPVESSVSTECPQLDSLRANILWQLADALMSVKKRNEAQVFLDEASKYSNSQLDEVYQGLSEARCLLVRCMEQMVSDPVYSVLQDSTLSFPSVVGSLKGNKNHAENLNPVQQSPPRKTQTSRSGRGAKSPSPDNLFDKLHRAQEILVETYPVAFLVAPISVMHKITSLLNNVSILLSAAGPIKGRSQPGLASCSIDSARTLAFRRERKVILQETCIPELDDLRWPDCGAMSRRSSLGASLSFCDIPKFQKEYIDILPKTWTALSISLSENRQELSITKLQTGHSPFVLRLPLGRNNSMDADEEVFGFEQGKSELLNIIDSAKANSQSGPSRTGREAKLAWWAERAELDSRLKDLLENIEKVWLGGFAGIFSQFTRKSDLLARFQKSFENILDKHLPSRRKSKRNSGPRVTLDSRILELFIGLGNPSADDSDFSEQLTDLLYFVVDVLQFHGELNAYAEIDFDSIVIEIHDALRCYHEAAHNLSQHDEGKHTILILDKALHIFPWESLPCMEGLAVSRLPSLGCLRDRISKQQKATDEGPEGHYIDRNNGAYILNPEGDLKNTQTTFQAPLEALPSWSGIVNRAPSEEEMKYELQNKDVFLYFGHGSGGQFIRSKEIRKMEKCAVTILMGCSSGALTNYGEFELGGQPIHYMHAGSAALVATLWDVTDRDIDRFAGKMLEGWGLLGKEGRKGTEKEKKKGGGRKKGNEEKDVEGGGKLSLIEAVAQAKGACKLKYLNAAAVCVYGIPVYIRD
ncbi:putative cell division-associated protein bimb protein [Botrytis fragariae]|uniref:separase n=1 Tax=Botrytis fragariae TaxID=1964551 RepID=A0A8H6ATR5_9HELO|nr:putative cell division-associated protein bimb protein [Botrytis fragariae]KAF5873611.1 putative cell division-associated protein bimb protein [Botrytis fragariae]